MHSVLTARQAQWLQDAKVSQEKKRSFLCRGPAGAIPVLNKADGGIGFVPALRGVRIQDANRTYVTEREAVAVAEKALAEMRRTSVPMPAEEERRLGLSSANNLMAERAAQGTFQIEKIYHLASYLGAQAYDNESDDPLQDAINTILDYPADDPIWQHLQSPDMDLVDEDLYACCDEFIALLFQRQTLGFLAMVSAPVPIRGSRDGSSFSFSWGRTRFHWVYGETFEEAFRAAEEWAKGHFAEHLSKGSDAEEPGLAGPVMGDNVVPFHA